MDVSARATMLPSAARSKPAFGEGRSGGLQECFSDLGLWTLGDKENRDTRLRRVKREALPYC